MLEWKWRPDGGAALWRWNTLKHRELELRSHLTYRCTPTARVQKDLPSPARVLHTILNNLLHSVQQQAAGNLKCTNAVKFACVTKGINRFAHLFICPAGENGVWSLCKGTLWTSTFAKGFIRSLSALVLNALVDTNYSLSSMSFVLYVAGKLFGKWPGIVYDVFH